MNANIQNLIERIQKKERRIIGLMSGTSLDGLDIVLARFRNAGIQSELEVDHFSTYPYTPEEQKSLRDLYTTSSLENLCLWNRHIAERHASMILETLADWGVSPREVDFIASHGQTIYHAPQNFHQQPGFPSATLQIGDADFLAYQTGIITLSDFRQKQLAAGGEGAPLAAYGDYLLFSHSSENRILLNIGGIANFTYLPAGGNREQVFATDVGPGNILIDAFIQMYFPPALFDHNGTIARSGEIQKDLLEVMKEEAFFRKPFPKTTGGELFNKNWVRKMRQKANREEINPKDMIATLTALTAEGITEAIERVAKSSGDTWVIYPSGGGAKNQTLIESLSSRLLSHSIRPFEQLGFSGDAKEAILFAVLANEALVGEGLSLGTGQSALPGVCMGKLSFPQ